MIALDNGDKIRGDTTTAAKVDFTLHGLVGNVITQLADGQLASSIGDLYTAAAAGIAIVSIIIVNTNTTTETVNLYLTPSAGTARRLIPKNMSLGVGYSLHTDGQKVMVLDTNGQLCQSFGLTGVTATAAELNILDGATLDVTELNYVDGVTSAIQTQMNLKAPLISPSFTTPTLGAAVGTSLQLSGLTASEILGTDGSKNLVSLAVATYPSLTELTYVKGVTSAIQTQLGLKAPLTAPTFATSITGSYLTASEILITDASKNIVSAAVATYPSLTELSYVKGLSSAIQTQLGLKAPLISPTFTTPTLGVASATSLATSAAIPLLLTYGQLVNISLTSQTVGATTLTIPDFASVSDTFVFTTLAQELTNKTLNASVLKGTFTNSGTVTLPAITLGGAIAGGGQAIGNISFLSVGTATTGTYKIHIVGAAGGALSLRMQSPATYACVLQFDDGTIVSYLGQDNSAGTALAFGGSAYAASFGSSAYAVQIFAGGAVRLSIAATGLATFTEGMNVASGKVYKVNSVQVVGARVVDARCDDTLNSGDATTDGVIDSLRDAMIAHGLIAAA